MGNRIAKTLKEARRLSNKTQSDLVAGAGVGASSLSGYENGEDPPFENLHLLAEAYGLPYEKLFFDWMEDVLKSEELFRRLRHEVFGSMQGSPPHPLQAMVDALHGIRGVHKAAKLVKDHLDDAKARLDVGAQAMLKSLTDITVLLVEGGEQPVALSATRGKWESLRKGVDTLCRKQTLFKAIRPTSALAELHQFPNGIGGMHQLGSRQPYYELWSVVAGSGVLTVLQKNGDGSRTWQDFEATVGTCGRYHGGDRHIWLNASQEHPLVILHLFYPYRQWDSQQDVGAEFQVHESASVLSTDDSKEVSRILHKYNLARVEPVAI